MSRQKTTFGKAVTLLIALVFNVGMLSATVFAIEANTVLPEGTKDCAGYGPSLAIEEAYNRQVEDYDPQRRVTAAGEFKTLSRDDQYEVIACSLKSGRFHLFMAPYMIRYFVEVMINIAGLVCVLFIVIGAFQYIIGSVSENKQQGKDTIKHALIGLVITLLSWIIVNVVQVALTGNL